MLSFEFSETHDAFRDTIRRFSRSELLPGYIERANRNEYPWKEHKQLAELGVLAVGLPEEFGGTGEEDVIALGIASEEIAYADMTLASGPCHSDTMGSLLAAGGTQAIKEKYLPGLISGELMLSLGLTEAGSGSDAAAMRMTATKVDGGWILNGEKNSVSHIKASSATIVFARAPNTEKSKGVSVFIVDLSLPGITIGYYNDMGLMPIARGTVSFENVFIPEECLIGEEGRGFSLVMNRFDFSRAAIALRCLGAAQASLDETAQYIKERETFGKPLSTRQGITIPLAEHYTKIEACRWMCYRTLWLRHTGQKHTAEAAMCKWWGPRVARDAIETALLIHGHGGWSDLLPFQNRFRDVMGFFIGDGTPEIQKLIISRERIGREVMD